MVELFLDEESVEVRVFLGLNNSSLCLSERICLSSCLTKISYTKPKGNKKVGYNFLVFHLSDRKDILRRKERKRDRIIYLLNFSFFTFSFFVFLFSSRKYTIFQYSHTWRCYGK